MTLSALSTYKNLKGYTEPHNNLLAQLIMEMPKRRKLNAVERDGVNYVRSIVEHSNCIFNEIHRENDYGNDGFIELVDGEMVTGKCFLVQIKSGKSYNTENSCTIPASAEHFNYWRSHKLPVIGIVFDPNQ